MNYIMMTVGAAKKMLDDDAIVMVASQDLDKGDCNCQFAQKRFGDCTNIFEEAETVAKVFDDFANQLRVFSKKQIDPINYDSHGKMCIMLFNKLE